MKKKLLIILLMAVGCVYCQKAEFYVQGGFDFPLLKPSIGAISAPTFGAGMDIGNTESKLSIEANYVKIAMKNLDNGYYTYNLDYASLLWSASFKYYAHPNFNMSIGAYLGILASNNSKAIILGDEYDAKAFTNHKETGIMLGMQGFIYRGFFIYNKLAFDLNNSDKVKTNHLVLGLGYKF